MLSSRVTKFYIRSSYLINFIAKSLYLFTKLFLLPLIPNPWQPYVYTLFLWVPLFFQIPYIIDTMQYLSFSVWLISLSIMPSSSIQVVSNGRISFFLLAEQYSIAYIHTTSFLFIHLLMDTKLFPYLVYYEYCCNEHKSAGISMIIPLSFPLDIHPGLELLDYTLVLFNFLRSLHTTFHSGGSNIYFHQQSKKDPFSPHPHQHLWSSAFFNERYSNRCEMISYCGFNFNFPDDLVMLITL